MPKVVSPGFSLPRSGLDPRQVHMGFVVDKLELRGVLSEYFVPPRQYYSYQCSSYLVHLSLTLYNYH